MSPGGAALAGAGAGLVLASALSALVAWSGPLDSPRARGLHSTPTVTSGGLAILGGTAVGLLLFAQLAPPTEGLAHAALAFGLAAALGLLGAFDDLVDMGAKLKLAAQGLLALLFALMVAHVERLPLGGGLMLPLGMVFGVAGTALWMVVVANAVNFMDGVDGLAAGSLAIVLAALGVAALAQGEMGVAGLAWAAAGAIIGFLPWNLPFRRLFQGDAGSLFSGFLAAGLAVLAAGRVSLYLVPMALTPFLADVLLTLVLRARRGERLFDAHRDHLYQVWLRATGKPHRALTLRVWAVVAAYSAAAVLCEAAPAELQPVLFAAGVAVAAAGWVALRRRLEPRLD